MKILIITSCTGEKKYKPDNQLTYADFQKIDTETFKHREKELVDYLMPASEMYTGQQHVRLIKGLKLLRETLPNILIDLKIVSAGYGLLDEQQSIAPYEMTFNSMKAKELRKWADTLNLPQKVLAAIANYDLVIFLLGKEYIKAVDFPKKLDISGSCLFLTGKSSSTYLPTGSNVKPVFLGNKDAKRFGAGLVALKGRVLEVIGEHVKNNGPSSGHGLFSSTDQ